ncbi:hypothetical protein [Actinomadura rupiterrae]|uniref:hypothetical protein n=1 Tax=Actinomadura rupiterrae TaxID=559627 RepID=UPI0020A53F59|nr:hypothetical protein [Actinomadura rupiterrae]MCP2336139.1 hypothetical protein [Actinomadura rupiterrae]
MSDEIEADMRTAVEERLAERITRAQQTRDRRHERLAELAERRRHGLAARHKNKLARLQPTEADAASRKYVYGVDSNRGEDGEGYLLPPRVVRFPVTKVTAKRIYYVREVVGHSRRPVIGYVPRGPLERDGEVRPSSRGWWEPDATVYAEPPQLGQPIDATAEVKRLRDEMANAHPDRGGTNEAFIAARTRYETALNRINNRKDTHVHP